LRAAPTRRKQYLNMCGNGGQSSTRPHSWRSSTGTTQLKREATTDHTKRSLITNSRRAAESRRGERERGTYLEPSRAFEHSSSMSRNAGSWYWSKSSRVAGGGWNTLYRPHVRNHRKMVHERKRARERAIHATYRTCRSKPHAWINSCTIKS